MFEKFLELSFTLLFYGSPLIWMIFAKKKDWKELFKPSDEKTKQIQKHSEPDFATLDISKLLTYNIGKAADLYPSLYGVQKSSVFESPSQTPTNIKNPCDTNPTSF